MSTIVDMYLAISHVEVHQHGRTYPPSASPRIVASTVVARLALLRKERNCCNNLDELQEQATEALEASNAVEIGKAIGHEARLAILQMIHLGDNLCACELQAALNLSHPTISHHTKILTGAGLIEGTQRGRWTHFDLTERGKMLLGALTGSSA